MFDLIVCALRGYPTKNTRLIELDKAVMEQFPKVECETRDMVGIDMQSVTQWWRKETDRKPLDDLDAWKVRLFVKKWLAGGDDEHS